MFASKDEEKDGPGIIAITSEQNYSILKHAPLSYGTIIANYIFPLHSIEINTCDILYNGVSQN